MTNQYKDTLNLPSTSFSMRANLPEREPKILKYWQSCDLYRTLRKQRLGKPTFILHDGPPYANGNIHLGHALNKVLKDIIVKSKLQSGYDVPFVPGWDCHGLPIEVMVEKQLKKAGREVSPKAFREACRDYAASQVELQREDFKRLGVLGDWENPYLTMDKAFEANVLRALARLAEKGALVSGKKPVHWCVDCQSALAEAEVEYRNKRSLAIDVRFAVNDRVALQKAFGIETLSVNVPASVIIWTTTPWTLLANEAVSVGACFKYSLVKVARNDATEYWVLASELAPSLMQGWGVTQSEVLAQCQGQALEGLMLTHPLFDKHVPVVLGAHVTLEAGTGAVHTAPAHGEDDFKVAKTYHLPVKSPVQNNGCYRKDAEFLPGQHVFKVDLQVVEALRTQGTLVHKASIQHSYPHCWRHKSPLIFRATPQWFVSLEHHQLRQRALDAIRATGWIPDWGQVRISNMVEGRPDWCISRQRSWGTPLALFVHKKTGQMHANMSMLLNQVADGVEKEGIEYWYDLDIKACLGDDAEQYEKLNDTLDVWFDAGVTHFAVLAQRDELHVPADVYLEGSDQHRGWFQSSLLTSVGISDRAPYKTVLTHGYTVDAKGQKMSKSAGTGIAPEVIIKSKGADILRLWVASLDYHSEIKVSEDSFQRVAEMYRRLRNTARFMLSNLFDFNPQEHVLSPDQLLVLDRWALELLQHRHQDIVRAYDAYQFHVVCQKIHHFCNIELGSFYLDVLKDRLYTLPPNSVERRSAQLVLYAILNALTAWLAPILSFTAEEIWQCLRERDDRPESVFMGSWETPFVEPAEQAQIALEAWAMLQSVRDEVHKVLESMRANEQLGSSLDAVVTLYCDEKANKKLWELLKGLAQIEKHNMNDGLRFALITSEAHVLPASTRVDNAVETSMEGLWVHAVVSDHKKCIRCWHHRQDVGASEAHPEACGRCVQNMEEAHAQTVASS